MINYDRTRTNERVVYNPKLAEKLHMTSGLLYSVCTLIASAFRQHDNRKLSINAEKYLLTADQNEELKERGLTVFDAIEGGFGTKDENFVYSMFNNWNDRLGEAIYNYQPVAGKCD